MNSANAKQRRDEPGRQHHRVGFDWRAAAAVKGLPGGGLNMAYECLDRHLAEGRGARTALKLYQPQGSSSITYAELSRRSELFALSLHELGIGRGDCVASLLHQHPDFFSTILGALRGGAIFCPLDPAFGPQPLGQRLGDSGARVVVTTAELFSRRLQPILEQLPKLSQVLIVADGQPLPAHPLCRSWPPESIRESGVCAPAATRDTDIALLHFTSGTTGRAKAAVHGHGAILNQLTSARLALDLHPGDIYWCTAEPGWITASCYGVLAPLACGATLLIDSLPFDTGRWLNHLRQDRVSVWYTTPTALRLLSRIGVGNDFSAPPTLRLIASVGEPLNPDLVAWAERVFGLPVHDTWWQTETGAIMIANRPGLPIRPGAMGRPLPGIDVQLVRRRDSGGLETDVACGEIGEIALRRGWPSMFLDYLGQTERYKNCFVDDWYLSGDLARLDADGYYWFIGRRDDLIKSAGHLISPFEVESTLLQHPAVVDAAVVGQADDLLHEAIVAFVTIAPGVNRDEALNRDILDFARRRLGALAAPRKLRFRRQLPRTRSGKILRRDLKTGSVSTPRPEHISA